MLSTLHTRDVAGTVTALRDLGISARSLASNLTGIVSQRLVRRLCLDCRTPEPPADNTRQLLEDQGLVAPEQLFGAVGCDRCQNKGYRGRVGAFEAVAVDSAIAAAIEQDASEEELRRLIRSRGTPSLGTDGLRKAIEGITSVQEVQPLVRTDAKCCPVQ